ncbi:hypothetical protein B5M47_02485 [candidate division CPR3 bacterium 4484_211]|uniref:YibE/F family protein n=1 Tax=candidate division CPR3 bacterium 4484_211 TaxID=1968527 RepID=A0A1W9NY08_UNCC3|nr:MAG: hypothetical protein B5M47_02485 [candidate division CPR3 bacterium 4484_211]
MIKRAVVSLLVFVPAIFLICGHVAAQEREGEVLEGSVVKVLEDSGTRQQLEVKIIRGSLAGQKVSVEAGGGVQKIGQPRYKLGDEVVLSYSKDSEGKDLFIVTDYVRRPALAGLVFIFVLLTILVGWWRGVSSMVGMVLSFLVIFKFILPQILAGRDPVWVAVLGSLSIVPLGFYLSHGFNKKTTVAVVSTVAALIVTGFLAKYFVEIAHLSGYANEEAAFLQVARGGVLNIKGLLLAGILIGSLGILDDITISQSAVVNQLKISNPEMGQKDLFLKAMDVGRDHIASMVNTLILVYTGAALPLFLLFIDNPLPFSQLVNYEIIAEEIVRTLVGSIGLVLSVPLTTFLACRL